MDDIARACQLAKGTLYLYFRNKDEIAFAVLLEASEDLLQSLYHSFDPVAPPTEQIEQLVVAFYRYSVSQPESFRYMFVVPHEGYSGRVSDELVERWAVAARAALSLTSDLLEQAAAQAGVRLEDSWSTAVALWSAVTGVIVIPSQEVRRPFVGDVDVEKMVLQTVRSFLAQVRPPTA